MPVFSLHVDTHVLSRTSLRGRYMQFFIGVALVSCVTASGYLRCANAGCNSRHSDRPRGPKPAIKRPYYGDGQADLVGIGREALREPNFALRAKQALGAANPEHPFDNWPLQVGWRLNGRENKIRRLGPWSPAEEIAA